MDLVGPDRVDRDRGHDGRVDPAREREDHRAEPVLAHVVPQPQHQGVPDLGLGRQPLPDRRVGPPVAQGSQFTRHQDPVDPHLGRRRQRGVGGGRQVEVDDEQLLDELRGPRDQGPVRRHHHRIAVEHELVLTADHVHVRDGRLRLGRAPAHQRQPYVVLVQLVRRAVDVHDQAHVGRGGHGERAARLPQVLADGQRDVDPAETHHLQRVARHEVPVLVEDAVVGQVVLEVGRHHRAPVQDGQRVARAAARRRLGADPGRAVGVEVPDDDRRVAEAVLHQVGRELRERRPGGGHKGLPEDQILDRVAGQHHLGERDQVRAGLRRFPGPAAHEGRVAGQVADGRVHLSQSDAQRWHASILPQYPRRRQS